ncbi:MULTISPECIES: TlpA disulfide reductase family protein [unclassified Pedobacter]|uniref:TlpA family protein disulfide reductase n=1 Tax=unclassified Pedobacter TaxID=2628915 RepID=UPI001E55923F|nr:MULTISPECIES: TlpA disulfide reductase family protein [unclassified Pedobacter]
MIKNTLLISLILFSFFCYGQNQSKAPNPLNEQTIVRGEDGMVYPYNIWQSLLRTGKYSIRSRNTKSDKGEPEYLIYELSAEQRKAIMDKMPKPRTSDAFQEGEAFKGFKVTDMNGNKYDLRTNTGNVIVLNFWFINCPPCKAEIPELNELVKSYADNKEVIFLAVALDSKYEIKDFLKTNPYQYNIIDDGRFMADKYGVKSYPTHAVIGKDGIVKFGTVGLAFNTVSYIKKTIDEALTAK